MDDDAERDIPTEGAIEKEEDRLKEMQSAQKHLFLVIFQVTQPQMWFFLCSCFHLCDIFEVRSTKSVQISTFRILELCRTEFTNYVSKHS